MKNINLVYYNDCETKIINGLTDIEMGIGRGILILRKNDTYITIETKNGYIQLSQGIDKFYNIEKLYNIIVDKIKSNKELNIEIEDKNNNLKVSFS